MLLRAWLGILWFCCLALAGGSAAAQATLEVVRGDDDYPPQEMLVRGQPTGLHVDLVEAAARRLGMKVRWTSLPWKRALLMVKSGQADAVTYLSRTPERETWALFHEGNLLSTGEIRFIVRSDEAEQLAYDGDLARHVGAHSLVTLRGFQFGRAEIDKAPRQEVSSMIDLMRTVLAGRGKVGVADWGDFRGALRDRPDFSAITSLQPPVVSTRNYIAFSAARGHAALAENFAQALASVRQSGEHAQLLKRYQLEAGR